MNVTKAIRTAIKLVGRESAALEEHLTAARSARGASAPTRRQARRRHAGTRDAAAAQLCRPDSRLTDGTLDPKETG